MITELLWDAAHLPAESGIYTEVSSWPYAGGHINGLTLPNGWSGQILINGEPWQGAALKCGDEIEVEILSTTAAVPPAVVDTEISHDAERCR